MNPATAAPVMPRPMVNDVAGPAPRPQLQALPQNPAAAPKVQVQPVPAAAPQPVVAQNFTTNLVTNIPLHNPQQAAPVNEDIELDKIMQDVGHELKKEEHQNKPGHFSMFSRKKKAVVTVKPAVPAQPVASPAAATVPAPVKPAPKAKHTSNAPVMTLIVTIVVTGLLMAAAVYSYR